MLNRLIKTFCFQEPFRNQITFSDVDLIRLNTENKLEQKIQLKEPYSTDADIYMETWFEEGGGLKKWLNFEAIYRAKENEPLVLPDDASLGFKVKTTAGNYWFDPNDTTWKIAGASDWNTESQINLNISTFPIAIVGNKKIGFVMNLKTANKDVTPEVFELKLLGEFDVEYYDDLVYDSFIRLLNENFRATSFAYWQNGSTSISSLDLNSVLENKGYNIFDVTSVYDLANDPLKLKNLHGAYAVGALKKDGFTYEIGTETFSESIPANATLEITFKYVPEISIKVNQDYFEVPSYPHISIPRITEVARKGWIMRNNNSYGDDFIRDKDNGVAIQQKSPSQKSYRFDFMVHTKEIDQFRLLDAVRRFFANNKTIKTWGLGNVHNIEIFEELDTIGNAQSNESDTNLAKGSIDIIGVLFFDQPSIDVPLVTQLNLDITKQTL